MDNKLLAKAFEFAMTAHAGTCRKGTAIPYIVHPMEAAVITMTMTENVEVIAAAFLHDVAEDTAYTLQDIARAFSPRIAELVAGETEDKRANLPAAATWQIRKQETLDHLEHASREIKMLALADKLSNLRAIVRDYEMLGDKLWDRFNQKNPQLFKWYYGGVAARTEELKETQAWQEYKMLNEKFFARVCLDEIN